MVSRDSDPWQPDESELENLIEEVPTLVTLRRFAAELDRLAWFKTVGEPLSPADLAAARAYADSLGFPDVGIAPVPDWPFALDCTRHAGWHAAAWEAEEQLRMALRTELATRLSDEALAVALRHVAAVADDALTAPMSEVAALWDIRDPAVLDAAATAAAEATQCMALAVAAEADPDHAFRHKFRLFVAGRWPIGIVGASFNLF